MLPVRAELRPPSPLSPPRGPLPMFPGGPPDRPGIPTIPGPVMLRAALVDPEEARITSDRATTASHHLALCKYACVVSK